MSREVVQSRDLITTHTHTSQSTDRHVLVSSHLRFTSYTAVTLYGIEIQQLAYI